MSYLKNLKWEMILFSFMSIIMGTLMWLYPSKILKAVCVISATILFIMGIRCFMEYRRKNAMKDFYKYELVAGIALVAGGVVVLFCMNLILSIVTYVIAIIIIVSGLMKIENAIDLKRMGCHWIPLLIFAIICILLGIAVLTMPMNNNDNASKTVGDFFIQCAGVIFAFTGFIDLITTLVISGKIKVWTVNQILYEVEDNLDDDVVEIVQDEK